MSLWLFCFKYFYQATARYRSEYEPSRDAVTLGGAKYHIFVLKGLLNNAWTICCTVAASKSSCSCLHYSFRYLIDIFHNLVYCK